MEINKAKLRQYFLENLSSSEYEEVELKIISDADFAGALDAAETELMEDYLENSLNFEEKHLFETNFLAVPERGKRLDFLRSLRDFAKNASKDTAAESNPPGFSEALKKFWGMRRPAFGFGLIALALVLGTVWIVFFSANNVNREIAAVNQRDLTDLDDFRDLTYLTLISGNVRSGDGQGSLESNKMSENVLFRLALPPCISPDSTFRAGLLRNENRIFLLDKALIYGSETGREFRLLIPASLLEKGEYRIEIEKENSEQSKITYHFAVR